MKHFFIPGSIPLVLGLGATCTIGYGTIFYSFSLLSLELEQEFSWSSEFIYGVYSLGVLLTSLIASPVGRTIDKYGARIPMCVGSMLVVCALIGQANMTSKIEFIFFLLFMEIVSIMVLYESAFIALTQAVGKNARKPITQVTLMAGFASTIFWPLVNWLLEIKDWRFVYAFMAFLHLFICLPIHWYVLDRKKWKIANNETVYQTKEYKPAIDHFHDYRIEHLMSAAFGIAAFCIIGIQIHIFGILSELNVSEKLAIFAGILIGPFQVLSRFLDMLLGKHVRASNLGVISMGLMFVGITFSIIAGHITAQAIILFAIFFGMGQGLTYIVRGALPLQFFGELNYGAITGRINRVRLIMTAISPISFAVIIQMLGATQVLFLLASMCLLSVVFLVAAQRRYDLKFAAKMS